MHQAWHQVRRQFRPVKGANLTVAPSLLTPWSSTTDRWDSPPDTSKNAHNNGRRISSVSDHPLGVCKRGTYLLLLGEGSPLLPIDHDVDLGVIQTHTSSIRRRPLHPLTYNVEREIPHKYFSRRNGVACVRCFLDYPLRRRGVTVSWTFSVCRCKVHGYVEAVCFVSVLNRLYCVGAIRK